MVVTAALPLALARFLPLALANISSATCAGTVSATCASKGAPEGLDMSPVAMSGARER